MAALVLVFRAPGSVHRDFAVDGNRFAHSGEQHAQALAERQSGNLFDDVDRVPELHGVGPSHVPQRYEPNVGAGIFFSYADDHDSGDGIDADLAGQSVRLESSDQFGFTVCAGLHLDVRSRAA